MRLATWNVNSLSVRLPQVLDWLAANPVEVLGLQELKLTDDKFPHLELEAAGYGRLPVCIAKTQSSFTADPTRRGAPSGHVLTIREVRLAAGAGFIVMVCGDMLTMPGLPKVPASEGIGLSDDGTITGLS